VNTDTHTLENSNTKSAKSSVGQKLGVRGASKDLAHLELPAPKYENASQLGSRVLLVWRVFLFILLVIPCMLIQLVLMGIGSYLDIPILGSLVDGSFVAKSEISGWPFFGWLAKMQRSLFIDREPKNAAKHAAALQQRLEDKDNLFLFPEGTTGTGVNVANFKSSLFSVAQIRPNDQPVAVQPVSIAYTHLDGMRMGRGFRFFFSWFGSQDLVPHLAEALKLGQLKVIVEFHPVVTFDDFGKRQLLAKHCFDQVSDSMAEAIVGRSQRNPLKI